MGAFCLTSACCLTIACRFASPSRSHFASGIVLLSFFDWVAYCLTIVQHFFTRSLCLCSPMVVAFTFAFLSSCFDARSLFAQSGLIRFTAVAHLANSFAFAAVPALSSRSLTARQATSSCRPFRSSTRPFASYRRWYHRRCIRYHLPCLSLSVLDVQIPGLSLSPVRHRTTLVVSHLAFNMSCQLGTRALDSALRESIRLLILFGVSRCVYHISSPRVAPRCHPSL